MKKTFNITVTMNERWVNDFCSMLKWMEHCGNVGHTSLVAFMADGDGDFRPEFEIGTDFERKNGFFAKDNPNIRRVEPEVLFDAC